MQLFKFHMFQIDLLPGVFQNILWETGGTKIEFLGKQSNYLIPMSLFIHEWGVVCIERVMYNIIYLFVNLNLL